MAAAQAALDCATAYRVTVRGHNFVLPEWGGVDDGTVVVVGRSGATAQLVRTGDGLYDMVLAAGATFYRRYTCPHWERRSGGAPDVLQPFRLGPTGALASAQGSAVVATSASSLTVSARISEIGDARVSISLPGVLPLRIAWGAGVSSGTWSITRVASPPPAPTPPSGPAPDQGPGGNPC